MFGMLAIIGNMDWNRVPCVPSRDAGTFRTMQERELKNGRLAMLAFIGFCGQELATGKVAACHHPNIRTEGATLNGYYLHIGTSASRLY